jgi:ketosteroid isomerase-like protein
VLSVIGDSGFSFAGQPASERDPATDGHYSGIIQSKLSHALVTGNRMSHSGHSRAVTAGLVALAMAIMACGGGTDLSPAQRASIARDIESKVRAAYDLSQPGAEQRMLALYADTGRIISAEGGEVVATRDSVQLGIRLFWQYVGQNMRQPKWIWTHTYVDVLSPNAAVFTGAYRVPHLTPRNQPHELAGVMTLVFVKRSDKWGIVQEHLSDTPPPPAAMPMDSSMKMP